MDIVSAATGVVGLLGSLGGKKTITAPGDMPGLVRLGQDGSRFTLAETSEVIVIAPNGKQASKVLPAGTYAANSVLGYDLQKGASKAYYVRASPAKEAREVVSGVQLPTLSDLARFAGYGSAPGAAPSVAPAALVATPGAAPAAPLALSPLVLLVALGVALFLLARGRRG